jgi:hypothetical protein
MAMSPTKSSGKATKKVGKAQKSVIKSSGDKVNTLNILTRVCWFDQ